MKGNRLLRLVMPVSLILALALFVPMLSGCFPQAEPEAPPEAPPTEPEAPPVEPEAPPVEPIIIGAPTMLSGPGAADGIPIINGMIMAVEELNANGGLLGRPIEYVTADSFDWTAEYQIAARDYLMGQGVDVFFPGYIMDPCYFDVFSAEETGGIPYLHVATVEYFADMFAEEPEKAWNTIQMDDTSIVYSPQAYVVLCQKMLDLYDYPKKTVAIQTAEVSYNLEISAGFREFIEADPDWEVVVDETHPYGSLEFGVSLAKIREADPGLIFFCDIMCPSSVAFVRQFLEDPTDSLVHVQYTPTIPEFKEMLGEESLGILWQTIIGPNPTYEAKAYAENYIDRFGTDPGACLAFSNYDMVMMWAEAVEAVGDVKDYRGIVDYIVNTHMQGLTYAPGGLNIDPNTNTDRALAYPPYLVSKYPDDRKGSEYGSTCHYYQIQMTSEGPKDILVYNQFEPNADYFEAAYGYPPQFRVDDDGNAEFQIPPWIGQ